MAPAAAVPPTGAPGDWRVEVRFCGKGALQASASGLLLMPPEDAVALVTDTAGDGLFRVVERRPLPPAPDGSQRVEVVNRAAIRVLAWKFWTSNRVVYQIAAAADVGAGRESGGAEPGGSTSTPPGPAAGARVVSFDLQSSNALHRLSGSWTLQPVKIHHSSLPPMLPGSGRRAAGGLLATPHAGAKWQPGKLQLQQQQRQRPVAAGALGTLASAAREALPPGLCVDAEGNVTATLVQYEQLAQPKGLPPGVRFVPGMSDAVRMSIGREVRQMLDKVSFVAELGAGHGLRPQDALREVARQLERAGGSFKRLRQQQLTAGGGAAAAAGAGKELASHPLLPVQPLRLSADVAVA